MLPAAGKPLAPVPGDTDEMILLDLLTATLARKGAGNWAVQNDETWCRVTPPDYNFSRQGWKIHVSATPLSSPIVLARCIVVLVRHECAFKFARDLSRVRALVGVRYPRGSAGKFLTAYPTDDERFRQITADLDEATRDLHGPRILSDRQLGPGSLVYYRYGVTTAEPVLTDDGIFVSTLIAPDGTVVADQRLPWFSPPSWAGTPFPSAAPPPSVSPEAVRLADRFVVRRAVRHTNRGGVYEASDERTGAEVIIKHARRHVGARLDGTDSRDDLRHEAQMLDKFAPLGISPHKVALFTEQGDLFLAEDLIPGVRLDKWVAAQQADGHLSVPATIAMAERLIDLCAAAHSTGMVLRDVNPANLMMTPGEEFRLIDLEAAACPGERVHRRFTMAYAAPEQIQESDFGPAPGQDTDRYCLGATLFYLLTGAAPIFPADVPTRRRLEERIAERISAVAQDNAALAALAPLIQGLMREEPEHRWTVSQAREFLRERLPPLTPAIPASPPADRAREPDLDEMIRDGLTHMLTAMTPGQPRLWASDDVGTRTDPCNVQHGAAGILAVLVRAAQVREQADVHDAVRTTADWIGERLDPVQRLLPGLYYGRSGTAWALHDAAAHLGDAKLASLAIDLAEQLPVTGGGNPDVAHGLAGAGLTYLQLWHTTGLGGLRRRAIACAEAALHAARTRGSETTWPIPNTLDSKLAGHEHYGFAHGVAGIGAFLMYAAVAEQQDRFLAAAAAAGHTLSRAAVADSDGARWPVEPGQDLGKPGLQHWCSGASGIGTFLIRLWRVTGDRRFLDLAEMAAITVRRQRWRVGNSACHGLAGDGEFLLDMARFTGQDKYTEWAHQIAAVIYDRRVYLDGLAVTFGDDPVMVTPDFNTGLAGIVGFLLRLRHPGPRWWMPDSLLP